jgi:signal recognition particle subunit SRP54
MGPLQEVLGMIPGMKKIKALDAMTPDEHELTRIAAIIDSMTVKERRNPPLIDGSRRKRIARGSGTLIQDVNRLLKNYEEMRKMMRRMTKGGIKSLRRGNFPF